MEHFAGRETLQTPQWLSLFVDSKNIAGVVPQKIGGYSAGPFDRGRKGHRPGRQHLLLSALLLPFEGNRLFQLSIVVDVQRIGDIGIAPAGTGQLALSGQVLIVLHKRP